MNRKVLAVIAVVALTIGGFFAIRSFAQGYSNQEQGQTISPGTIIFRSVTPGWAPPGSIWINSTNLHVFVQTNGYNLGTSVLYSNMVVYNNTTNLVNVTTQLVPTVAWVPGALWATNGF